jgi:uncharacterized protein YjbJ (UPF0337 family)
MNKDQVKGAAREAAGKMQKAYGNAKNNTKRRMKRAARGRDRDIERHAH